MQKKLKILSLLSLLLSSCVRGIVIDNTKPLLFSIEQSFLESDEIEINQQAIPTLIRLAEGFYRYHPENPYYLGKLAFLYGAFCFGYIDQTPYDEIEDDFAEQKKEKVLHFYKKSFDYSLQYLEKSIHDFSVKNISDSKKKKRNFESYSKKTYRGAFLVYFFMGNDYF